MLKQTLSEEVYLIVKEQIIKGYFHCGQRLTETGIAKVLSVSATPVREAFKRLETEGFIENVPYKGVYVKTYTKEEVICAYHMRAKIEGIALGFAMKTANEDSLKALEAIVSKEMGETSDHILKKFIGFHEWIIYSSNIDMIVKSLKSINGVINIDRLIHNVGPVDDELVIERHKQLYELIKNGKRDQAIALVEEMVLYIMKLYLHEGV